MQTLIARLLVANLPRVQGYNSTHLYAIQLEVYTFQLLEIAYSKTTSDTAHHHSGMNPYQILYAAHSTRFPLFSLP